MKRLEMNQTIYRFNLEKGEPPITQGDVFSNLPYFSNAFLLRSSPNNLDVFKNENQEIWSEVIQNNSKIQFEGFYYPKWGIIASQDCDIKPKMDLIFYPLEKTNKLINAEDIILDINRKIKNTTRRLYLPELTFQNEQIYGPFEIIFHNPFTIPYELVEKNYDKCWRARLIESAKKIFIGKLSQFFTRLPIEEFIFLENREITKYLRQDWKKFWKEKTPEQFNSRVKKIGEIIDTLQFVKRKEDISKIFYYDVELIEKIRKILKDINWFQQAENLYNQCNQILNSYEDRPSETSNLFEILVEVLIINKESFQNKFYNFYQTNREGIMKMRQKNKYVEGILPSNLNDREEKFREYANKIFKAKEAFEKIPDFLINYEELFEKIEKTRKLEN
ncbi:MAG: hypothetical protein ACFFBC_00505 [Promethearchaeota archaeon]